MTRLQTGECRQIKQDKNNMSNCNNQFTAMKKLIKFIIPSTVFLLLISCANVEYMNTSYYTFINNSSWDIELQFDALKVSNEYPESASYTIHKGECLSFTYWTEGGFPHQPLFLTNGFYIPTRARISNGNTEIMQYSEDNKGLYDNGNYTIVKQSLNKKSSSIWYEYEFTDAFFEQDTTE